VATLIATADQDLTALPQALATVAYSG
jgi:hypothetical protein